MIKTRAGTQLTAAALAVQIVLSASTPAFAQRRRAEPEANPDFAQSLQGGGGGSPIGEPSSAEPTLAPEEPAPQRSQIQGVQIGAGGGQRPAAQAAPSALETRVTVRVKGAPLATFLDTIAAQSKVNFIMTEGVETKRVTAFLQNVTVREALQVLLEIKGLTYQQIGRSNTYVVTPRSKQAENYITRIYALSHIPLIPLTDASGQSGGGGGSIGGAAAQAVVGGGTSAGGAAGGAAGGGSDSNVAIVVVLQSVLTKQGKVAIEPRTNSIVVTDIPEVFPQVEQIIAELDRKAPQVMIEAQIVEIDSNRARELGFEWGGANGELASFTAGARDTRFPMGMPSDLKKLKFFDPATNIISGLGEQKASEASGGEDSNAADSAIGSNLVTSIVDLTSLKIVLRALVSRSEARFLGKPKILTLNNKTAVIAISANQAVGVQSQASAIGQTGAQSVSGAERISTGLTLRVTPQVNKEGYITMLVQPSFTDVTEAAVSRSNNRVFDPISRAASTLVRVRNAQTLVLGGLLRSTETKVVRKVPLLGYIPIIGWFFTSSSTRRQNSDLVIFITPTIVSD